MDIKDLKISQIEKILVEYDSMEKKELELKRKIYTLESSLKNVRNMSFYINNRFKEFYSFPLEGIIDENQKAIKNIEFFIVTKFSEEGIQRLELEKKEFEAYKELKNKEIVETFEVLNNRERTLNESVKEHLLNSKNK